MRSWTIVSTSVVIALATATYADDFAWVNVQTMPDDLINTGDAWSAVRIDDPQFVSNRIAADEFTLTLPTHLATISYYNVSIGNPPIIAGDWYIFAADNGERPGTLLAAGTAVPYVRELTGWTNPDFGPIYRTVMHPTELILPDGHYFVAFRTYQGYIPVGKHTVGALSTRWAHGQQRAYWSFDVLADGTVTGPWVPLQQFNGVNDQEWAFELAGQTLRPGDLDCDGRVNFDDIDPFVLALTDRATYEARFPNCYWLNADCSGDGTVSFDDIDPFVALLSG